MLFCNVAAGISVIGNALPMMQELTGLAPNAVAAVFGGICLLNALGRLFWGAVSDHIGRNRAFALIYGMQICAFVGMIYAHDVASVAIAVAVVLLCFGGGFGTMPSFNADYFGTRHLGANYGAILTAWGAAGIAGPLFAAEVKDFTGSFANALWLVAAMLLLAMVLPVVIKKPTNKPPHAEQQPSTAAIVILDRVRAAAIRSM
jgi:OFA family oxalate/formate antiporter-like MFS transporter